MPTGGVTTEEKNLKSWFDAGVTCVGLGSQLISKEAVQNKAYDTLTDTVKKTLALIQTLKQNQ
jgi:2-dehydro-3-deoxyphosphogluconate aldolase/(4S)-4-hydroxy-2-oxoglutarate aldolase